MKRFTAILCIVFLLAASLAGCKPAQSNVPTRTYIALQRFEDKLGIIYNDTCIMTDYTYSNQQIISFSLDGSAAVCLTEEGTLLYIHDGEVEKIVEHPASYCISTSGNAVAFRIEEDENIQSDLENGLYLYQKENGQIEQVITDDQRYVCSYALSPDGQTLAYVSMASIWSSDDTQLAIYRDGTSTLRSQFEKDASYLRILVYDLISINNSADVIYLHDASIVASMDGEGNLKKIGKGNSDGDFYTNADHSQLLFSEYGTTYLSRQCERAACIGAGELQPVPRAYTQFHEIVDGVHEPCVFTCDFDDLTQQVMTDGSGGYYYPDENGEFVKVAEYQIQSNETGWLDPTGSYLYQRDSSYALYMLDLKNGAMSTLLAKNASVYAVSPDCGTVYYVYSGLNRCSGTAVSESERLPLDGYILDVFFSENGQIFFEYDEEYSSDLYTLTDDGEPAVLLQNLRWITQYACGMIIVCVDESLDSDESEAYYIIRGGELIELKFKNLE